MQFFHNKYFYIKLLSFQIVGPAELCQKISEGLHQSAREKKWQISIHQCESIADVVKAKIDISVDFIIFAFNLKASHTFSEVSLFCIKIIFNVILC